MKPYMTLMMVLIAVCCSPRKRMTEEEQAAYRQEIDQWHTRRLDKVKAPNGWLNLVGLYWLEPGINTFGSDAGNSIVFPAGKIASRAGYFLVEGNVVTLFAHDSAAIQLNDRPVNKEIVYHPDSTHALMLQHGSLRWNIIQRESKLGIRLRDDDSDLLHAFKGLERYPVDPGYRVEAVLEPGGSSSQVSITNVLGQTYRRPSPGMLVFTLDGREQRLIPIIEDGSDELFIIFADATTGKETYGGGRFLYAKHPDDDGKVILDFNKAYNPPCVFTPYATCPLPPEQNVLPLAIRAGEKNYDPADDKAQVTSLH